MKSNSEQFLEKLEKEDKIKEKLEAMPRISEAEYSRRMDRLRALGKTIGEDFDMKIEVGKEPGWRYIFKPVNKIEVDPVDLAEKPLEYCFGVIAHEGAHRKISRTDFIPKNVWQARGFSFLMNAVEDPRVNNWVSEKYSGARDWVEAIYNLDVPTEDKIAEISKKTIGYVPKHQKFGLEVIRYWHTGKFSSDNPPEVQEALDKTIKYAKRAYETIPETSWSTSEEEEEDIRNSAELAYKIIYSAIWPEYQKLVEKAEDDEKTRQQIKEMLESGEIELPPEGLSGSEPLPLDELPDDLKKKIKKKLKEKLAGLSEEERKKWEEEAEKKACKNLDDLETELDKELKGKFSEQPETRSEEEARKEKEAREAKEEKEREKEIEEMRKKIEAEIKAGKSEYDKAYEEVYPFVAKLAGELEDLFIAHRQPKWKPGFPTGLRVDIRRMMEFEAQKKYEKLWQRKEKWEKKDYRFMILVDLSGSMRERKINETFKGVVLLAEVLNRVGIKFAIYGFQDVPIKYKDFDEELNDPLRDKMGVMKKEPYNKGQHNQADWNSDGYCLNEVSKKLSAEGGKNNFLIVLSDGEPEPDSKHAFPSLKQAVKNVIKTADQTLIGIGLGPGTEHVQEYYPESIPNVNVEKLSQTLCEVLRKYVVY